MTAIQSITKAIEQLSDDERQELLRWFDEQEQEEWDAQIAADFDNGKLDSFIQCARDEATG